MRKIHYLSGVIITIFAGLHLVNHVCSIFGADTHIEVMDSLRLFYRNIFIETILLCAVAVQIVSGLRLIRANRKTATSTFDNLHLWTGFYLAIFFVIHVSAVLAGRFLLNLDTNFYFGVAGLNTFPFNLFFIPYYSLAIISFFGHVASIHSKKMKRSFFGLTPAEQSKTILLVGVVLTILTLFGLTNQFQGVNIPAEYKVLVGK